MSAPTLAHSAILMLTQAADAYIAACVLALGFLAYVCGRRGRA